MAENLKPCPSCGWFDTATEAVLAWNRRAPQSQEPVAYLLQSRAKAEPHEEEDAWETEDFAYNKAEAEQWTSEPGPTEDLRAVPLYTHPPVTHPSVEEVEALEDALRLCERNLRVVHEASGPVPMEDDAPSSFEAWRAAHDALASLRGEGGTT